LTGGGGDELRMEGRNMLRRDSDCLVAADAGRDRWTRGGRTSDKKQGKHQGTHRD
jgi:hypothetical protein